jgi:multidrug efflux pump subunit AcrA (membrane-fusion protein)
MDTAQLELNQAELSATIQRFVSEAQLARVQASPAEMHIAIAKAEETKASLKKVQFNLEMASVSAPIDGVVLEGDIEERIGSPVERGEALLKISQLNGMFAELRLPEREATRVRVGSVGEAVFESRPEERFPIKVMRIEPLAVPEEGGNMLIVRTHFTGESPEWWRPGMTGTAKLDCGERSLLWLFTRRAIDYLRMRFWF